MVLVSYLIYHVISDMFGRSYYYVIGNLHIFRTSYEKLVRCPAQIARLASFFILSFLILVRITGVSDPRGGGGE